METEIIIIGHSLYPKGIKGIIEFIVGLEDNVYTYHIDNNNGIEELKDNLSKHMENNKTTIIFADIPGGSPHQKSVELSLNNKDKKVIIFAGVGTSFIIDIVVKSMLVKTSTFEDLKNLCQSSWEIISSFSTKHSN